MSYDVQNDNGCLNPESGVALRFPPQSTKPTVMKELFAEFRGAVLSTLILAVVCCGLYPLVVFGIAQAAFPDQANGSLIVDAGGTIHGSRLLGQRFTADNYFHSRPSAAGSGYDAGNSGGSNLGPTSKKLADAIAQNVADYRMQNGLTTNAPVPADAVTASGSGLDPHISVRNAGLQAPRIAKARNMPVEKILALIRANTDSASLGFLGEPGVNVLKLNLALDK
jgi:potassium-transporting ATPase KdpC subunit